MRGIFSRKNGNHSKVIIRYLFFAIVMDFAVRIGGRAISQRSGLPSN